MPRNLFISYDLHNPQQNYHAVIEKIKSLGGWAKVHQSFWYLSTSLTCEEIFKKIRSHMDENDSLMVVDASANDAMWYNLKPEVSSFIKNNWAATSKLF